MRGLPLLAVLCGCSAAPSLAPSSLAVHFSFAPLDGMAGDVTVTSATLHLTSLSVVSDAAAVDARTQLTRVDLSIGDAIVRQLPSPPPGLYSTIDLSLVDADEVGVDVEGLYQGMPLHAAVASGAFDVMCAKPVRVDAGTKAELDLAIDMQGWFDGLDLTQTVSDEDDQGIVISSADNVSMAADVVNNVMASFRLTCK